MVGELKLKIVTKCTISMNIITRSNVRLDKVLRTNDREEEQNLIICMTNYCWSPRTYIINVLIAIYVPHTRALDRIHQNWLSTNRFKGTYGGVHTSRHQFLTKPLHQVSSQEIQNQISPFSIIKRKGFERNIK